MAKKPSNLGLYSGLPAFVSEEADREQLRQMPKALEPTLARRAVQRVKRIHSLPTSDEDPLKEVS